MTSPAATAAPIADPECIHCRQAVTPCDCFRGRGCEHNGWKHVRTGEHQCPGMLTKAHPSGASLRALLTGSRQPDERQVRDVAVAAVERVMFAYSRGHARAWIDVHEAADLAVSETLRAAWSLIAAKARAAERQRLAAVISPEQFRKLADWFDADDEFKEAMFPETWSPGSRQDEVQRDLRKFADLLDGAP